MDEVTSPAEEMKAGTRDLVHYRSRSLIAKRAKVGTYPFPLKTIIDGEEIIS